MIKAVFMDVGGTIILNRNIDFEKALKAVYDLDKRDDKIDFERYIAVFQSLYRISFDSVRKISSEVRIDDFLESLNEICDIKTGLSKDELQWFFQCNLLDDALIEDVKPFLEYAKSKKYPIFCVSNSCMDGKTIARELKEYKVLPYFKEVISSADVLFRKPRKEIFDYTYGKLLKIDPTINRSEVLFIGDSYECDVIGATNAGFNPVWLNYDKKDVKDNSFPFINVSSYQELIDVLKIMESK